MALTPIKRTDPLDFPKHMVPVGLTYQWSAEKVVGEPNPVHKELIDRGWMPVPSQWHQPYPVRVQGNILLCHARARDEEAERIAGAEKNIEKWQEQFGGFSGGVRIQHQTADGVSNKTIPMGDPALARKIMPPAAPEIPVTRLPPRPVLIEAPQTQTDPVEAFIQSRDSGTQAWLRDHPGDARVLATNSDPRRAAKLNAADADAFAEGFTRGSKEYFQHVEKFLGITLAQRIHNFFFQEKTK